MYSKRTSAGRGQRILTSPRRTVTIRSRKRTIGTVADPGAAQRALLVHGAGMVHQPISPRPAVPSMREAVARCVPCSGWPVAPRRSDMFFARFVPKWKERGQLCIVQSSCRLMPTTTDGVHVMVDSYTVLLFLYPARPTTLHSVYNKKDRC